MNVNSTLVVAALASTFTASGNAIEARPATTDTLPMEHLVVTSTREAREQQELTESVGVLTEKMIEQIAPSHPAEALNRIAGVHINNLGGEGHMASIRQPITTAGVYLFLEDGLPTRPTGFFNHNGLYEINIPQSSRVEVIKGPASALYGSDAIGGVINVLTRPAPAHKEVSVNVEAGSDGWYRGLVSVGGGDAELAGRLDLNTTRSEGFREAGDYDRQSLTGRVDAQLGPDLDMKVVTALSQIDQSGISGLEEADYRNAPSTNYYHDDIGFREVEATRLSAEFNWRLSDSQLLSITPFYRDNSMTMMPSWMVTYDPNIRDYELQSYGALLKYRQRLLDASMELIVGMDIDSTPSSYREELISVTQVGDTYTDYARTGQLNYDFDAEQRSLSPYVHLEYQLHPQWRVNAGVRYDHFSVDYDNHLPGSPTDFAHHRPDSDRVSFEQSSPKLGLVYQYHAKHNVYANWRHAFRAPTVGAMFRPGSLQSSTELEPVTSVSAELGFRGQLGQQLEYELAYYDMSVEDDIVSVINNGTRYSLNAGETRHRGIEAGFDLKLSQQWQLGLSYTHTDQTYEDFSYVFFSSNCFCNQQINFAGNDVAGAPQHLANLRLVYTPQALSGLRAELEWDSLGSYFTDETNTQRYTGHELFNLRLSYAFSDSLSIYARGSNLSDERYSTYTSNQVNDPDISYRPGLPRSLFVGLRWTL